MSNRDPRVGWVVSAFVAYGMRARDVSAHPASLVLAGACGVDLESALKQTITL